MQATAILRNLFLIAICMCSCDVSAAEPPDDRVAMTLSPASLENFAPGTIFRDCAECPEMVVLPRGTFTMGSPSSQRGRYANEGPAHTVSIDYSLSVGRFAVTRGQWRRFTQATGFDPRGCFAWDPAKAGVHSRADGSWLDPGYSQDDTHPVVCINWYAAKKYTEWLNKLTGKNYRLLSEAEYEYASRAGTTSAYSWGNNADGACRYANGADRQTKGKIPNPATLDCDDGYFFTAPVGSFRPNAFGLYDMSGNAWSWLEDCLNESYTGAPSNGSAWTSGDCQERATRGGAWNGAELETAARFWRPVANAYAMFGLRLARTD